MRILTLFIFFFISAACFANNIIANGTRFIYPAGNKEITIQLTNKANRPAIAQSWIDNGDPTESPDIIKTPFLLSPPVARLEAKDGQAIRIKLVDPSSLATDKETLFWLNILDIPPMVEATDDQNILQFAIRSRFKLFYRPKGLGERAMAASQLQFSIDHKQLVIFNPSPFFVTVNKIMSQDNQLVLRANAIMIPPKEQVMVDSESMISGMPIMVYTINDYGGNLPTDNIIK